MFKTLNPILHSQLRLAVVSLLMSVEDAEFNYIKEKTGATSGNLSIQIGKLKTAGYIEVDKSFRDNFPLTTCRITKKGVRAFEEYVQTLEVYLQVKKK
ncbi:transcriptional regulator [Echinicola strongylocentroti]|uniref:Transcriptional regulator n=1 Tax=Echinicola strongylocentroti TaxID=1795355 RepID=A0A2Z4II97_9BACT|nr:transcriptional regulator [Echinicola strongylocentroti]AWW30635.1 transcriptional regulator [Echinicola strongylocentroti]